MAMNLSRNSIKNDPEIWRLTEWDFRFSEVILTSNRERKVRKNPSNSA